MPWVQWYLAVVLFGYCGAVLAPCLAVQSELCNEKMERVVDPSAKHNVQPCDPGESDERGRGKVKQIEGGEGLVEGECVRGEKPSGKKR